jgi:WD40 repeat protein
MRLIPFPQIQIENYQTDKTSLHFSADGRTIVAVDRFDTWVVGLTWWDLQKQSEIVFPPEDLEYACGAEEDAGYAVDPVISPDHRFLAYVYIERGPEYSLRLVDRTAPKPSKKRAKKKSKKKPKKQSKKREQCLAAIGRENYSNIGVYEAIRFSPDGRFLVAAVVADESQSGIYRWSVEKILRGLYPKSEDHWIAEAEFFSMPNPDINPHSGQGRSLVFSPDGTMLAAGLWSDRVLVWEFPSGRELPPIKLKKRRQANAARLAFHPKTQTLAVADQSIALYDPQTATRKIQLSVNSPVTPRGDRIWRPNVYDIEFHPSGHLLASACGDSLVRWWDGETGIEKETFDWEIGKIKAVAFSPDGCLCGAVGEKGIAVWDVSQ